MIAGAKELRKLGVLSVAPAPLTTPMTYAFGNRIVTKPFPAAIVTFGTTTIVDSKFCTWSLSNFFYLYSVVFD